MPQSASLSAGGVQKLFGQCPNRASTFLKGASLCHPSPTNIFNSISRMGKGVLDALFETWQTKNEAYFISIVEEFKDTEGGTFG